MRQRNSPEMHDPSFHMGLKSMWQEIFLTDFGP